MKKAFMIHGFEGSPNGGWRPWLMGELEKDDIYSCALSMPTPDDPKLDEWVDEIQIHVDRNKNDEIYLVGHSLGVPAILRFLETSSTKVKGVVLVSGPLHTTDNEKVNRFFLTPFDFNAIKSNSEKFLVIHGDNDTRVPLSDAVEFQKIFGCELIVIKNGGHLNGSSGWTKLPELLEGLQKMMI